MWNWCFVFEGKLKLKIDLFSEGDFDLPCISVLGRREERVMLVRWGGNYIARVLESVSIEEKK